MVTQWHVICFRQSRQMSRRFEDCMGRRTWLAGLWIALAACVSPSLPPDDPPEPSVELGIGVARLSGHVGEGAVFVLVHNRDSGLVFGQRTASGAYDFEVQAERCDLLALWYTSGLFQSTQVVFRPADLAERRGVCGATGVAGDASSELPSDTE
jgi:hypothetical protein